MNKKIIFILLSIVFVLWAGIFYWENFRGAWPLVKSVPSRTISPSDQNGYVNTTGMPLKLPDGFSISVFTDNLPGPRVIVFDQLGNLWISQTSEGIISLLEIKDGKVNNQYPVFKNLNNPHGLVFDPEDPFILYVAEEDKISKVRVYSEDTLEKIADLPSGGGHYTRTLGFGPDDSVNLSQESRLYVSIGSSCNVCVEKDARRGKVFSMNKDGSNLKEYAVGLRNAVFFTWHPLTKKMWATEMGRDLLGDDTPPDEINIVEERGNYGWPNCYGKNIHDVSFDKNTYVRNPCSEPYEKSSYIDLQAHSAPLGLVFVPSNWPEDYRDDLLVAFHGSWNRTNPTGYKLIHVKLDKNGNYLGTEDFIFGWLNNGKVYGRPVDTVFGPDGNLYVSDDRAGLIYKIEN